MQAELMIEPDDTPSVKPARGRMWWKLTLAAAALLALALVSRFLPVAEWLTTFQQWVRGLGATGSIVYVVVYALCCVFFVPASILTLGAGAVFGLLPGFAVVVTGAFLGATASFFLARTVLRHRVEQMLAGNRKFVALDRAIGREGGKIVFLIRLSPIFPFTYINYAFGLTSVKPLAYAVATLVGMLPGTFAFTYIGFAAATAASGEADRWKLLAQIVGAVATLAVAVLAGRIARDAIRRAGVEE